MNTAERDIIIEMCRENDVSMVGVFGSTARGEASACSDIDLLVRFAKPKSLLSLVRLERKQTGSDQGSTLNVFSNQFWKWLFLRLN